MRSTRLRKFRKKYQPLIISFKVVLVLYMVLFSVSYLTTDTVAYYSDDKNVSTITITAGTWDEEEEQDKDETDDAEVEDESSLAFVVEQETIEPNMCPTEIEVEVTNEGDGPMLANAFYEVYFIEEGDPKKDGEKVTLEEHEGMIEILEQGHTEKLVYETSTPGFYQFVIYQDEDASEENRIWSEVIEVVCEEEEEVAAEVENDEVNNEQENQEEPTSESEEAVENQETIEEDKKEKKSEANTDQDENTESNSEIDEQSIEDKDVESDEKEENTEVDQ